MQVKKVLFINTETSPFVADSQLSITGKKVPESVQAKGCEIRTFMPKWGHINERRGQLHEVIRLSGMNIIIDQTDHPLIIKVASIPTSRLQVYFIDNDDYFQRRGLESDENGVEFEDNGERAVFYARGVLETVKKLRWIPDVIHCQGWMSSIVPLLVREAYQDEPCFKNTKIVTSLFPESMPESYGEDFKKVVEFKDITVDSLKEYNDKFDKKEFAKIAVDYSDAIIIPAGAEEDELVRYANASGKPSLVHPGDDFAESYREFYNSLG